MFKKTAIAVTTALALTFAAAAPATTASASEVGFGIVIGDGNGNGFFFGNNNNGWGNPGWGNPGWGAPSKMSCHQARKHIKGYGYKMIIKIECNGNVYRFKAKAGFGAPYQVVKVHAINGNIWI
ncbi:MAG: hypothetical protein ACTSSQ_06765 [Alphaproteobacteria bacterium]